MRPFLTHNGVHIALSQAMQLPSPPLPFQSLGGDWPRRAHRILGRLRRALVGPQGAVPRDQLLPGEVVALDPARYATLVISAYIEELMQAILCTPLQHAQTLTNLMHR